jgi:ribosomal protein S18 acetylase RimI-like enzyme
MTSRSLASVTLRPVSDADREFLIALYGSTREAELSQVEWAEGQREAFIRMQFEAQDHEYRRHNPAGHFDVIELDGCAAGRLYVDHRPGDIRIVDISLAPEFRGSGVGTCLVRALQEEAAAADCKVSIHVEIQNPAAELYHRLGFAAVAEHGVYRRMEWVAS